ncbi:permease [Thermococcus sp. P6]|uniref:DMT family transporter n=1 Tax=Thermococcus sp. P6 TaxID=122420 RepID=UPI000B5A0877|nr:EamA family transporter [Thermococcus sp. P6]ASJ10782.1 permease [Thermococcus sp. P6]
MNGLIIGITAALTSAFSWALATILIKIGMRNKSPIAVNIVRLYIVSALFGIVFLIEGRFSILESLPLELLIVAFVSGQLGFVVGDYFYFNALKMAGVSRTVPVTSTYPLWTILWAVLFLGREVSPRVIVGALLIFGAIVLVRKGEEEEHVNGKAFIFALLAPISWSLAILTMDWLTGYIDVLTLAGLRMMMAALGITFLLPRFGEELSSLTKEEMAVLFGAAFFGLFIGQYLFVYSVNLLGSQMAAPISAINPVISSALAVVFLKESPSRKILEGLLLAVLGVVLISTG